MMQIQRLSQGHLQALTECPRKFQHFYLDLLAAPLPPEQRDRMQWGSDFHRLMQQRELGLPIAPFLAAAPDLEQAVSGLVRAAPQLFGTDEAQTQQASEQARTLLLRNYLFTVVYDLVLLGSTAQIIDWKTYNRPRQVEQLAQDWQTRLYLYILAETSDYPPAAISFTYWFVLQKPQPVSVQFAYSDALHRQTHQDIQEILDHLDLWLPSWQQGDALPQVPIEKQHCTACHFASRCDRLSEQLSLTIAEIEEIAV